jgi:hypothetical protein
MWKVKEMGEVCSTCKGGKRCVQGFGGETRRKGPQVLSFEDGRTMLKWILKKEDRKLWTELI